MPRITVLVTALHEKLISDRCRLRRRVQGAFNRTSICNLGGRKVLFAKDNVLDVSLGAFSERASTTLDGENKNGTFRLSGIGPLSSSSHSLFENLSHHNKGFEAVYGVPGISVCLGISEEVLSDNEWKTVLQAYPWGLSLELCAVKSVSPRAFTSSQL